MVVYCAVIEHNGGAAAEALIHALSEVRPDSYRAVVPPCVFYAERGLVIDNEEIETVVIGFSVFIGFDLELYSAVAVKVRAAADDPDLGIGLVAGNRHIKIGRKLAFYRYIGEKHSAFGNDIEGVLSIGILKAADGSCIAVGRRAEEPCSAHFGRYGQAVCARVGSDDDLGAAGLQEVYVIGRQAVIGVVPEAYFDHRRVGCSNALDAGDGAVVIGGAVIEYDRRAASEVFAEVGFELAPCSHRAIVPLGILEACQGLVVDDLYVKIIIFDIAVIVSLDLKADTAVGAGEEAAVDDLYLGIAVVTCQSYIKGIFKTAFYRYIGELLLIVGDDIEGVLSIVILKGGDGIGGIVCGRCEEP